MTNSNKLPLIDDAIKDQIIKYTKESFSHEIEEIVWNKDISYLEALTELMEKEDLEPEAIQKLISKDLYSKLEIEAENLRMLKTSKNRIM